MSRSGSSLVASPREAMRRVASATRPRHYTTTTFTHSIDRLSPGELVATVASLCNRNEPPAPAQETAVEVVPAPRAIGMEPLGTYTH